MSIEISNVVQAMCSIAAGGAAFFGSAPGCTSVVNTAVGLNTLTLDQALVDSEGIIVSGLRGTVAGSSVQVVHTTAFIKQVRTYAAGVLADTVACDLLLLRKPST